MKQSADKELMRKFGMRCRGLRVAQGVSQLVFSNSIGMDRSYYASIETGLRNVTLSNMSKIARGFGVSLEELMRGID